jgi:catechol 2,3-dioxygenase-like lactoylglutathione lyase family enzyme
MVRRIVVDHVLFVVRDVVMSRRFYEAALEPLGITLLYAQADCAAFGLEGADDFAVCQANAGEPATTATHIAFPAEDRDGVDAFHAAALRAGGREKFPPGLRPEYHPGYYAGLRVGSGRQQRGSRPPRSSLGSVGCRATRGPGGIRCRERDLNPHGLTPTGF